MLTTLTGLVHRTRQHHAIEHATLLILGQRYPGRRMGGYSDPFGFTIFGAVSEESVRKALGEALLRLQAGEAGLAIHPYCGTNLAVTALLTTVAALVGGSVARRDVFSRFTATLLLMVPALLYAPGLGLRLQRYTTCAAVNDRWVKRLRPLDLGIAQAVRVEFD